MMTDHITDKLSTTIQDVELLVNDKFPLASAEEKAIAVSVLFELFKRLDDRANRQ